MNKRRSFPQVSVIFVHVTDEFEIIFYGLQTGRQERTPTTTEAFQLEVLYSYTL